MTRLRNLKLIEGIKLLILASSVGFAVGEVKQEFFNISDAVPKIQKQVESNTSKIDEIEEEVDGLEMVRELEMVHQLKKVHELKKVE